MSDFTEIVVSNKGRRLCSTWSTGIVATITLGLLITTSLSPDKGTIVRQDQIDH